jgi:hypothetical protein
VDGQGLDGRGALDSMAPRDPWREALKLKRGSLRSGVASARLNLTMGFCFGRVVVVDFVGAGCWSVRCCSHG